MNIQNKELINKIRTDYFMNNIYRMACDKGVSETEMLTETVIALLDLKDEVYQQKIDELRFSVNRSYLNV